jgi:UDP-GlcNAc:undecaprenyl-phosphate/decaprenyl-phosphate GlcNAc-1-phosphate transferase
VFGELNKYLTAFLTSLVVTYSLTPLVRTLAIRFGVVDLPNERRPHKRPTARGGGLAVVLGVQAACLLTLAVPWPAREGGFNFHWWQTFSVGSLILLVVGLFDDIRGLRPFTKLAGQTLAALIVSLSGTHFGQLFGFKLPWLLDSVLVVLWILATINAFNLIDGLDGLASGLAIISAIGLCGILLIGHLPGVMLVLVALIAACLGFLRYNFHPASIFLGDTGSMFLGFTLGVISLQTATKSTFILSLTIPMLVLGVPIYDALLAIWRRSVRRLLMGDQPSGVPKRMGIMQADVEHLHHRLLRTGLSTRRVAGVLLTLNAGLVLFGLLITSFKSHQAGIFLLALLAVVYVLMRHLAVIELRDTGRVILNGLRRPSHATLKALGYPVWDVVWLSGTLVIAMWLFEPSRTDFWHCWFLDCPVWVTPTFSLLAASRVYVTVWTRARGLDVLMLLSTLFAGLLLSLAIALLIDPSGASAWVVRTLVIGGLSHPAILGIRVVFRLTEEIVILQKGRNITRTAEEQVVLYGAGGRCQLFLKERSFSNSSSFDGRQIAGLIDDEPSLHGKWVYGYPVLGGRTDFPRLITRHRISMIIITATLTPESRTAVQQLSLLHGLELSEWSFENRILVTAPSQSASAFPAVGGQAPPLPCRSESETLKIVPVPYIAKA